MFCWGIGRIKAVFSPFHPVSPARQADILGIQANRSWIANDPAAQTGWLGALQDEQIGRALSLTHRHPAGDWTVNSLAAEIAMSRSAFAARFVELVGQSPMHYVAQWRTHMACTWLKEEDVPLIDLADRLGYQSEGKSEFIAMWEVCWSETRCQSSEGIASGSGRWAGSAGESVDESTGSSFRDRQVTLT